MEFQVLLCEQMLHCAFKFGIFQFVLTKSDGGLHYNTNLLQHDVTAHNHVAKIAVYFISNVQLINVKRQKKKVSNTASMDQSTGKAQRLCVFTVLLYHKIPMLLFVLGKVYNITIYPTTTPQTHTVQGKKYLIRSNKRAVSCKYCSPQVSNRDV